MSTSTRLAVFAFLYVALFIAAMATITGGVIDIAAWASAPVILSAEVLVLGMIYMTTFHSESEEPPSSTAPRFNAHKTLLPKKEKQQSDAVTH